MLGLNIVLENSSIQIATSLQLVYFVDTQVCGGFA